MRALVSSVMTEKRQVVQDQGRRRDLGRQREQQRLADPPHDLFSALGREPALQQALRSPFEQFRKYYTLLLKLTYNLSFSLADQFFGKVRQPVAT
jgi:hypothetical protein